MQQVKLNKRELPYDVNEAMKLLRTNLQFYGKDKKVILLLMMTLHLNNLQLSKEKKEIKEILVNKVFLDQKEVLVYKVL